MRPDRHDKPESLFAIMRTRQKQIKNYIAKTKDFSTAHQKGGAGAQAVVTGLSPRRPAFDSKPFYVEFAVDKAALGQVLFTVLLFAPVSIIPQMLHTRLHLPLTVNLATESAR